MVPQPPTGRLEAQAAAVPPQYVVPTRLPALSSLRLPAGPEPSVPPVKVWRTVWVQPLEPWTSSKATPLLVGPPSIEVAKMLPEASKVTPLGTPPCVDALVTVKRV